MAPYRPPGRSNRSGRTQADNDVFEGLPVKQWTHVSTRVSLVPPASEIPGEQNQDRWGEPPMPRDWQFLQPWTQQLLRLARSGKVGQKRKATRDADYADGEDYAAREEDGNGADETNGHSKTSILGEDRGFIAKKWRHVPEHALVPEHLHLEYLARSRKGMPSFYHNLNNDLAPIPMRKTRVFKILDDVTGEVAVYEIIIPEGQPVDNEVLEDSEHASKEPTLLTVGTFVDGLGTANIDGVIVGEIKGAAAIAQRRNRPPPKKKGGPGRGKKRVTFTNPDGSTYTTIVPNATKIVPQPGQTVKHVAKGEEAVRDVTAEEAASMKAAARSDNDGEGDDDGDDDEEGDEDGDDGDDREDGELVDEGADTQAGTETNSATPQVIVEAAPEPRDEPATELNDINMTDKSTEEPALRTTVANGSNERTSEEQPVIEQADSLVDDVEHDHTLEHADGMLDAAVGHELVADSQVDIPAAGTDVISMTNATPAIVEDSRILAVDQTLPSSNQPAEDNAVATLETETPDPAAEEPLLSRLAEGGQTTEDVA